MLSALVSIVATTTQLRVWTPAPIVLADAVIPRERSKAEDPHLLTPDLAVQRRTSLPLGEVIHGMQPTLRVLQSSHADFASEVLRYLRAVRFAPARRAGKPVCAIILDEDFTFSIERGR